MTNLTAMVKKISWLIFGKMSSDILAFVFYATLARVFGQTQMGNYAFAFAVAHIFSFGIELGLQPLITREVAKNRQMAAIYLGNLILPQVILTVIVGALLIGLIIVQDYPSETYIILIAAFIAIALKAIGLTFVACLEAIEAMEKSAILSVMERAIILSVGFSLILASENLEVVMMAYVISSIAYLSLATYWCNQAFGLLSFALDTKLIKRTIIASLPFLGASALNVLYSRIDVMMIYSFIGETETGAYTIANRCIESSLAIAMMTGLAIYPSLSRSEQKQGLSEPHLLFNGTLKWLSILGMVGVVFLVTIGDDLVVLIFGKEYVYSGELIRYMSVLFLFGCMKVPYWRLLFAEHREKIQLSLQVTSIIVNIALNLVLIPRYGALGAVWASIISEIILLASFHWYCAKMFKLAHVQNNLILLVSAIAGIGCGLGVRDILAWPYVGTLAFIIFSITALGLGLVTRAERENISSLCQKVIKQSTAFIQKQNR